MQPYRSLDAIWATRPVSVAVAQFSLENCLEYDANPNAGARIIRIDQVIAAVDVINVDVVGVIPSYRPRILKSKPKAAVLEARKSANQHGFVDYERVFSAKVGAESIVRYTSAASGAESKCRLRPLSLFFCRSPLSMLSSCLLAPFFLIVGLSLLLLLCRLGLFFLPRWLRLGLFFLLSRLSRYLLGGLSFRLFRSLGCFLFRGLSFRLGLFLLCRFCFLLCGFGCFLLRWLCLLLVLGRLGGFFVVLLLRAGRDSGSLKQGRSC